MKKIVVIFICILTIAGKALYAGIHYKITGKISGIHNKTVYLEPVFFTPIPGNDTSLNTFSANGEFEFSGTAAEIQVYKFYIDGITGNRLVVVANEAISITGSADKLQNLVITESPENEAYQDYLSVSAASNADDSMFLRNFIVAHSNRFVALYRCYRLTNYSAETLLEFLSLLDVSLKSHSLYKQLEEKAKTEIRLRINMPAPDFTVTMPDTSTFTLSSLRGKYVLLDFWASWCAPCRSANQSLKKILEVHKSKGFEIVSFSIDQKIKEWQRAVEKDGITWTSVVDFKAWKSDAAMLYNVQLIPASVLISPEGKIIAKDLSPEELDLQLKQLLKE